MKSALEAQGTQLSKVSSSVVALGSQLKSFEGQVSNVSKLNADVEAIITLERHKYLDLLRRQVELEESRQPVEEELEEELDYSIVVYPFVSAWLSFLSKVSSSAIGSSSNNSSSVLSSAEGNNSDE